ncbi:UNVERIFIED_CONTAM: hypothetical protein PYX00_010422 [Menopon gallinae]|uniref:Uncharacterized protein n=1 Tax=Menopon gallinae TaxID=328185 RepID=A0AAW2HG57_9NEOP
MEKKLMVVHVFKTLSGNFMFTAEKEVIEETIHNPSRCNKSTKIPKSVINYTESRNEKPKTDLDNLTCDTLSQEEFMRSVEEDAKKRSEDRKRRIAESDAIKAKANKAFSEKDYEKALDLYNKAIDVRKDSCVLYMNRALTLLNLELYTRALKDAETALKLDENSFRATMYKWHSLYEMGEEEKAEECMQELKSKFSDRMGEIEEYEKKLRKEEDDDET